MGQNKFPGFTKQLRPKPSAVSLISHQKCLFLIILKRPTINMQNFLLAGFFTISLLASINAEAREYHLYGDKREGTKFRRIIYSSPVSLAKNYARLSDSEKRIVRASYPKLNAGDTPPYPKKGVRTILKPYVQKFRFYGNITNGLLFADIGIGGEVSNVRAGNGEGHGIPASVADYMTQILHKIEFEPALCSGIPCEMTFQIELLPIKSPTRNNQAY